MHGVSTTHESAVLIEGDVVRLAVKCNLVTAQLESFLGQGLHECPAQTLSTMQGVRNDVFDVAHLPATNLLLDQDGTVANRNPLMFRNKGNQVLLPTKVMPNRIMKFRRWLKGRNALNEFNDGQHVSSLYRTKT